MPAPNNPMLEFRKLTLDELAKKIVQERLRLQELRSQLAIGKLTNHQALAQVRRSIARMETVKQEKIMLEELT